MPDYKHLEDGTPVTAEEFNTRFDTLMGEDKGVNAVTPDMLALGALRHNQIPALVGKAGESGADLAGGFTKETGRTFIDSNLGTKGVDIEARTLISGGPISYETVYRHTFPQPLVRERVRDPLDPASVPKMDADAIIVLANAHVNRLWKRDDQFSDGDFLVNMRERLVGIAFRLVAIVDTEYADGSVDTDLYPLLQSPRGISPGFTIDINDTDERKSGYPMLEGSAVLANYDLMTFKDVALRGVFVMPDFAFGGDIHRVVAIKLQAGLYGFGCGLLKGRIDKMNLTAIPIHAKVDKHGGS